MASSGVAAPSRGCRGASQGDFPGPSGEVLETPSATGCPNAACVIPRAGRHSSLSKRGHGRETLGWREERGGNIRMDPAHPRGARAAPRSPPGTEGWPLGAGTAARGGCHPWRGTPGAAGPPGCGKLSKRADGAGERRQEEEESRKGYFLTLHILQVEHFVHFSPACKSISGSAPGLGGGACESTAAGGDVAAGGGTGWEEGSPMHRVTLGGPPDPSASSTQPGHNTCCKRPCSVVPAASVVFIPPGWHGEVGAHTLLLPSCLTLLEIKYPG